MKKIFFPLLGIFIMLSACKDDELLDQVPHNLTDNAYYTSADGATQGINAAYAVLQLGEGVERIELLGTVCSGDALPGGEPGGNDQPNMQEAARFNLASNAIYVNSFWRNMYTGIYRCNILLSYLEKSEEYADFPEDLRNRIKGEAYFLRGLFHFKLQIFFGGYPQLQADFNNQLKGVPYIDHPLLPEEWSQERPTLEYTWSKIEEDFQKASELLPLKSEYDASETGRATKGAATAMLAKTYLYQNKFELAYNAAKEVINSEEYFLMGETGHEGPYTVQRWTKDGIVPVQMPGYQYIWQAEANNCDESIFDVQHYGDNSSGTSDNTTEGNILPQYYGVRRVMTYMTGTLASTEYFWGFILPTPYFIQTAYKNVGCQESDGTITDPRYKYTVIAAGDSIPFQYAPANLIPLYPDSALFDPWGNWPSTGYSTWKYFLHPESVVRAGWYENPQNTKYFRFADLLLIGAEAAVQIDKPDDAKTWINRVRDRARNAGNTGYPQAYTTAPTVEDVYAERRVELAFESHQFFDIVRTGRAKQILQEEAMLYPTVTNGDNPTEVATVEFGNIFQIGKNEIFPIPITEIDLTKGTLTQNPNY